MSIVLIIPEPSAVVKTNELLLCIKVDSTRIEKVRSCFFFVPILKKSLLFRTSNKMRPLSSSCFILESNIFLFINKKNAVETNSQQHFSFWIS